MNFKAFIKVLLLAVLTAAAEVTARLLRERHEAHKAQTPPEVDVPVEDVAVNE